MARGEVIRAAQRDIARLLRLIAMRAKLCDIIAHRRARARIYRGGRSPLHRRHTNRRHDGAATAVSISRFFTLIMTMRRELSIAESPAHLRSACLRRCRHA